MRKKNEVQTSQRKMKNSRLERILKIPYSRGCDCKIHFRNRFIPSERKPQQFTGKPSVKTEEVQHDSGRGLKLQPKFSVKLLIIDLIYFHSV